MFSKLFSLHPIHFYTYLQLPTDSFQNAYAVYKNTSHPAAIIAAIIS